MTQTLVNTDCLDFLKSTKENFDCIFADPPDNTNVDYQGYCDNNPYYYPWLETLIHRAMQHTDIFWLSYYYKHDIKIKQILLNYKDFQFRTFIWTYAFGQYRETDAPNNYRPILRINRRGWRPNMQERVPSVRELLCDERATGLGRVPSDVWAFSLIQGNNHERRSWHVTQHPEAIYQRIAWMSGGKTFLDLFAGSGTCFRALPDYNVTGIEVSPYYCNKIKEEYPDLVYL